MTNIEATEPPTNNSTAGGSKLKSFLLTVIIHAAVIIYFVFATLEYFKSRKFDLSSSGINIATNNDRQVMIARTAALSFARHTGCFCSFAELLTWDFSTSKSSSLTLERQSSVVFLGRSEICSKLF